MQSSGKKEVTGGANVLVAIFSEQESQAVYVLKKQNIARIDVVNFVSHGISRYREQKTRRAPITPPRTRRRKRAAIPVRWKATPPTLTNRHGRGGGLTR